MPRARLGWCFFYMTSLPRSAMDAEQFHTLMDEIKQSRDEVKELKREVSAVHERTTRELAQKITKSSYQFKKKAHEIQFTFNSRVED